MSLNKKKKRMDVDQWFQQNTWLFSAKDIRYQNQMLEANLLNQDGKWVYNKIHYVRELHSKRIVNENGHFRIVMDSTEDDEFMGQLFPYYQGLTLPKIDIEECVMLSVECPSYDNIRQTTLSILKSYQLANHFHVYYGYLNEQEASRSCFFRFMKPSASRKHITVAMLEIFELFVQKHQVQKPNAWLLYVEDDVRPINVLSNDLRSLYHVPQNAEIIRPYIGANSTIDIRNMKYQTSFAGGNMHACYLSISACQKILHYTRKYGWKYPCDVDLFKLAVGCTLFPTGIDGWNFGHCNHQNDITPLLEDSEKINMYSMSHIIFNQMSLPCV